MIPRHVILRQPHMAHLLDRPALEVTTDAQLAALEAFMRFYAEKEIGDPQHADLRGFAALQAQGPEDLAQLEGAFRLFGMPDEFLHQARIATRQVQHQTCFRGISATGRSVDRPRSVSVPLEDLPADWQKTLRRMRLERTHSKAILDRMQNRLGMFVWSAQQAGHPVDLGCVESQQALYNDIRTRSAAKNDGAPRWAYLRSAWEEMRRFAEHHALPQDVYDALTLTYSQLGRLETAQDPLKFVRMMAINTASGLLADADKLLDEANAMELPQMRHAGRNHAAAISLGIGVSARPGDVHVHHVFGRGIFFEPGSGGYHFRYVPGKTRTSIPEPLDILLDQHWSKFIDALILQDQDPRYLGDLRAKAFAEHRPLYVNYDGTPCGPAWYSSAWSAVVGTGGHIARTLIYDEMADLGEFGIRYASSVNHHRSARIPAKYRSENALRASQTRAQDAMLRRCGRNDDISDLL